MSDSGNLHHTDNSARVQFWLFCGLLALALIGMGVTQTIETGGWYYWLALIWIYALVSVGRAWRRAKSHHEPVWPMLHKQVFHWLGAVVCLYLIFALERTDILAREAASDIALLVLALAAYLAGIHFERMFVLIGLVLAIMAVIAAYVEQYTLWIIMIPVAIIAAWLFAKNKRAQA